MFTILAAVAEMERELIADRVREGMRRTARVRMPGIPDGVITGNESPECG